VELDELAVAPVFTKQEQCRAAAPIKPTSPMLRRAEPTQQKKAKNQVSSQLPYHVSGI
jgi:hypothetical protein